MEQSQVTTVESLIKYLVKYHDPTDIIAYTGVDEKTIRNWARLRTGKHMSLAGARRIVSDFPEYVGDIQEAAQEAIDNQLEREV